MDAQTATRPLDLEARLRRSPGRGSRKCSVNSKLTREELRDIENRAAAQGKAVGEWAREVRLREARGGAEDWHRDAMATELVAVRMLMVGLMKPLLLNQKVPMETISEIMAVVRREKHNTARELMEQYRAARAAEPGEAR